MIGVVRNFVAILLKRAEVGKLFGGTDEKAFANLAPCFVGGVHGAEITTQHRLRTSNSQNCKRKNLHLKTPRIWKRPRRLTG
jgi:hypothetical protein